MTKTNYTPGPWKKINWDSSAQIRDEKNNEIALLRNQTKNTELALPDQTTTANANLIAAAPELLEALIDVLRIMDATPTYTNLYQRNKITSLIKKATE
jgi:hypothetical protein